MARSSGGRSCMIEQFTSMRPISFSGGADPLVAENWVQDMEDMLAVLLCIDELKVSFATFKLTEEVKRLWRSTRLLEEKRPEPIADSKIQHFPATVKNAKAAEFLHLTQGPMTIQQYAARFIELSWFAPYLVSDEERKVRKFKEGLRYEALELNDALSYEEVPVQILNRKEQKLRTKSIPLVKVLWCNYAIEEASWELEEKMHQRYPQLFSGNQD
ncbi:uncharacterized protein LOC131155885 [Malania oleifera]|uniref:uncharacterized protein LOC131155885 n=1 Tax=Malania oleifera TaxID=397392 RepID=UPI0025AEA82C|nr:uncharacterized protein LOC131155885 [Malania oleifera]